MIITAEEESSNVVTIAPTIKLEKELEVYFFIQTLAFSPNTAFSVSDKFETANKNKTKPAMMERIISDIRRFLENTKIKYTGNLRHSKSAKPKFSLCLCY